MKVPSMYHEGMRHFQDHFGTRALADRLDEVTNRDAIDLGASKMIERSTFFFLATTDADGWPDCSYKGGEAGFVKVANEKTLLFPSFDGNGMYRSIGNIHANPKVGLLFIDMERPKRLRINGTASVISSGPLLEQYDKAELVVSVRVVHVFPNCPRYIHQWQMVAPSMDVPVAGEPQPVPQWKYREDLFDALPADDPARFGQTDEG